MAVGLRDQPHMQKGACRGFFVQHNFIEPDGHPGARGNEHGQDAIGIGIGYRRMDVIGVQIGQSFGQAQFKKRLVFAIPHLMHALKTRPIVIANARQPFITGPSRIVVWTPAPNRIQIQPVRRRFLCLAYNAAFHVPHPFAGTRAAVNVNGRFI